MAKKNGVEIPITVTDNGTLKQTEAKSKKAAKGMDKVGKSSRNAQKGIKGVAQTASAGTKNFAGMARGTGGLVGAYASLAAQLFAVSAAFQFLKNAGQLKSLKSGQAAYSSSTGIAMRTLTEDIIAATDAQVSFSDASQAAAIGIASGLNPDQLTRLGKAAKDTSLVLGRDVTDSFNRLVKGVTKAEPELLDELGIILRLKKATEDYGLVINKNADDLTAFERTQAVTNEVLSQSEEKYSKILAITGGSVNQFAQLGKAFDDIINKLKEIAAAVAGPLATVLINVPYLIFGAIGLLMKPVLTTILPGLGNVVASTEQIAVAAKKSFNDATIEAEKYKKSLMSRKMVDPASAQKGVAKSMKGVSTAPGSLAARAQAGKQLNNRQIKALEKQVTDKKLILGKEEANFKKHLARMRQANTVTNKRMVEDWEMSQKAKEVPMKKFEMKAKASFSRVASFAAKSAKYAARAFSALGWISLIATLGMVVFEMFRTKETTESAADKFDVVNDKVKSVNEELKHFNQIQNVLNEDGQSTIATLGAIGAAMANISLATFGKASSLYDSAMGGLTDKKTAAQETIDRLESASPTASSTAPKSKRIIELEKALAAQIKIGDRGKLAGGTRYIEQAQSRLDMEKLRTGANAPQTRDGTFAALEQLAAARETLASSSSPIDYLKETEEGLNYLALLKREKEMIEGSADAKISNSTAGKAYVKAIKDVTDGTAKDTEALKEARENYKNFAQEIGTLTKLQKNNADTATSLRKALFPETKYDKYLTQLQNEITLQEKLGADSKEAKVIADARIVLLNEEVRIMTLLNNQLHEQKMARDRLKTKQAGDARGLYGYAKERNSKNAAVESTQLENDLLVEQMFLKSQVAIKDGVISETERKEIETLGEKILLSKEAAITAKDAANEMKQMGLSVGATLEASMGSAIMAMVQGTMTLKEAFASMAKAIILDIAKMISKMLAFELIKSMFGGTGLGDFMGVKARSGGVFQAGRKMPGYATGGVANGSTSGYPAMLHGREAVVPLGSGNSIPVDLKNGGGTTNNIIVNVSSDGQTNKEGSSGPDMDKLGGAVAKAVQMELQNQKRSGGILNPYGAA